MNFGFTSQEHHLGHGGVFGDRTPGLKRPRSPDHVLTGPPFDQCRSPSAPAGPARMPANILHQLMYRQLRGSTRGSASGELISRWAERTSVISNVVSEYCDLPEITRSTISISFSPSGAHFASTHGDHTVKLIQYSTGKVVRTLRGHPRTPWTVKYHPFLDTRIASGCLGFHVKVWNTDTSECECSAVLRKEIVSLAFHPRGDLLIIASGKKIWVWDYETPHTEPQELVQRPKTLRCVGFTPDGQMVSGEASPKENISSEHYINSRKEQTVQLLLWEFDHDRVLDCLRRNPSASAELREFDEFERTPNVVVEHAVLYNDGGFDVSRCGRFLTALVHEARPREVPPSHTRVIAPITSAAREPATSFSSLTAVNSASTEMQHEPRHSSSPSVPMETDGNLTSEEGGSLSRAGASPAVAFSLDSSLTSPSPPPAASSSATSGEAMEVEPPTPPPASPFVMQPRQDLRGSNGGATSLPAVPPPLARRSRRANRLAGFGQQQQQQQNARDDGNGQRFGSCSFIYKSDQRCRE